MTPFTISFLCGASFLLAGPPSDRSREVIRVQETLPPAVTTAPAEEVIILDACPHRCKRCRKVEADIEKLRATNPPGTPDLCVSYEVEIEDACAEQCLDLMLRVRHRKNVLLEAIIPLVHPTEIDDDEQEFEGAFVDQLGVIVMEDRKHLRIDATVVDRNSNRKLERESERIRSHDDDRHGCIAVEEEIIIQERILPAPPPEIIVPQPPPPSDR